MGDIQDSLKTLGHVEEIDTGHGKIYWSASNIKDEEFMQELSRYFEEKKQGKKYELKLP